MKAKRMLSAALALALILGLSAAPAGAADRAEDVTQAALRRWNDYKVLQGDGQGNLLPDATLTRGAFAAVLDRVMGYRTAAENSFTDLPEKVWYTPYMLRLNAVGVLNGNGASAMPEAQVTRQEAVALLGRALGLEESAAALSFTDKANVPDWCAGYLSVMVARGCFANESAFRPAEAMTRAEAMVMLDTLVTAFVNTDGNYSADASGSVVVNAANVTLKDMKVGGDLIIADGVGNGDVYLDNVTVAGRVILRGCGANSFHLLPGTVVTGTIIVTKASDGGVRLVNESGKVLPMVNVADGRDGVTLTGDFKNVVIASDAPVALVNATVKETVSVTAPGSSVTLSGTSSVKQLDVAKTAEKSAVTMTDSAKVATVNVAGNGLTLDNTSKNKPTITVDSSVTAKPTDPGGNSVNTNPPSGGGGGGGGTTTPTPTVTTLTEVTALLPSPQAGKAAANATPAGAGYTVKTVWSPELINNTFAKGTVYTANLTFSLATDTAYQWGTSAPTVTVTNSTSYGGIAKVSTPGLDTTAKTVTVTAEYPKTAAVLSIDVTAPPKDISLLLGSSSGHELSVVAHVKADGVVAPNYQISYKWYQSSKDDIDGTKPPIEGATASSYSLPAGLTVGTTYYACGMTADGVAEVISKAAKVTVMPPEPVKLSNLSLATGTSQFPGFLLSWKTDAPQHTTYNVQFFDGENAIPSISGIWNVENESSSERSILMEYALRNLTSAHKITKISVTPYDDNGAKIGETVSIGDLSVSITFSPLDGVRSTFDPGTGYLTFSGVIDSYRFYAIDLTADGQTNSQTINSFFFKLSTEFADAASKEGATVTLSASNVTSQDRKTFTVNFFRTGALIISNASSSG